MILSRPHSAEESKLKKKKNPQDTPPCFSTDKKQPAGLFPVLCVPLPFIHDQSSSIFLSQIFKISFY